MDERVAAALHQLPDYLGQHVLLSASALALGLLISLPLVVLASRSARFRWPILAFASVVQTVPGIALLALFYPILLALSAGSARLFGHGFSALGFLPALLALTLYSVLPILRNGATAILNLDPAVLEAARGVGMTARQQLLRVELPLAAPLLMAGVRTSAVWVIGTATLATPVGQTSLGNYIFSGLQVENWVSVLFGCLAAVALAMATDQLLALIEHGIAHRRRASVVAGAGLLLVGIALAVVPVLGHGRSAYVIGAKNFTEQYILLGLMEDRVREQGASVARRAGLGSVIAFRALASNDIDAYVDYSGTLWANVLGRTDHPARATLLKDLAAQLQRRYGVTLLGPLGFENAYALAMRREQASELGIRSIEDLARYAPDLTIGGDFEFFARPEWAAVRDRYGLHFRAQRQFQSTFMYHAVATDEVQVISAFSSDGRIAGNDLVVLEDPREAILPYDAVLLIAPARATDATLLHALRPLVNAIPIELMREANRRVDDQKDKVSPRSAAAWLARSAHLAEPATEPATSH